MKYSKQLLTLGLSAALALGMSANVFASDYIVRPGDSLWKIAQEQLGSGSRWGEVYEANRGAIKVPRLIYPGQTLVIPDDASVSGSLELSGVGNARELGGYRSADGRTVRHGALLRTAALSGATDNDLQKLREKYHLAVVADFRMDSEVERAPDPDIDGVRNLRLPIMDTELLSERTIRMRELLAKYEDPTDRMAQLFAAVDAGIVSDQMYVEFLAGTQGKAGYRQLFEELLALPEGQSLLFHCTQGKDRTGVAAMLILSALDVDEETILMDYMLTNEYNAALIAGERQMLTGRGVPEDRLDDYLMAMDQVRLKTMTNALDWLRESYGSVNGYLEQELGIGEAKRAALKDRFLR